MFRSHPNAHEVSRHVTELPGEFEVRRIEDHWSVVGPTGLFVVGRSSDDVRRSAEATSALAHELRGRLSEIMSWVPFVDAVLVADSEHHGLACTVVELDMLAFALTAGGQSIDVRALAQLSRDLPAVIRTIETAHRRPLDRA